MDSFPIYAINFYQRHISPYKGYRCAHHAMHGGMTCSEWMKHKIIELGFMRSVFLMKTRLHECKQASNKLNNLAKNESGSDEDQHNDDSKPDKEDVKDTIGCCMATFPW